MDKVLVNTNVIQGIISAYHHADQDQTRIYGILLGSKKDNIYRVTDAVYGFIFETESSKSSKKELVKMNEDSLKSLFNSLTQKFKLNNPGSNVSKTSKEKEIKFQNNDTLAILGGFVTDKELLNELYRLHVTLDRISPEIFCNVENINKIILLIDPNHQDKNDIKYGIKTYEWNTKSIKFQKLEKTSSFIVFKELPNEIVQQGNNLDMAWGNNLFGKIYNLKIEKNDKRNINELLLDLKNKDDIFIEESNAEYIKNKIKESILYLNIFEKILENDDEKNKNYVSIVNEDDYNQISYILSQLELMLSDNEIIEFINNDIDKKCNINSLTQLLEVQLTLSDKIRELIN
jgi:hypothetical protein